MYIPILSSIVDGVSNYFTTKQEIKKVEVEAQKDILKAEATAKIKKVLREAEQDHSLDMQSMKNMEKSWKDEVVLVIFMIPLIMSFIPSMQQYVVLGFEALSKTPEWYQYIIIGMVIVIYGMRGLLKYALQLIITKKGKLPEGK